MSRAKTKAVDILAVAAAIRAARDASRERQMRAMRMQKPRHRPDGHADPLPWQENAIRIMEDRT